MITDPKGAAVDNRPNWMGTLIDKIGDVPLCQLPIPGSHDSGTMGMVADAETQDLTITEQLNLGIRYFDLRPRVNDNEFYVHHGDYRAADYRLVHWHESAPAPHLSFDEPSIFLEIRLFLQNNPKEVVILKFESFDTPYVPAQRFNADDHIHFRELMNDFLPLVSPRAVSTLTLNSVIDVLKPHAQYPANEPAYGGVIVFYQMGGYSGSPGSDPSWANFWPYRAAKDQLSHTDYIRIWDPFWQDYYSWLGDDDQKSWDDHWVPYNQEMLWQWAYMRSARFFVTQAQMEVGGADMKVTLRDSAKLNDPRNVTLFTGWMTNGVGGSSGQMTLRPNILTMDFIEYGNLSQQILDFFGSIEKDKIPTEYQYFTAFEDSGDFAILFGANQNQYIGLGSDGWVTPTPDKTQALRFRFLPPSPEKPFDTPGWAYIQVVGGSYNGYFLVPSSGYRMGLYGSNKGGGWQKFGAGLSSMYSELYIANATTSEINANADANSAAAVTFVWT